MNARTTTEYHRQSAACAEQGLRIAAGLPLPQSH